MTRLVVIDGKSVFYRGYYAMGNLSLSDGTPTGGVYGFAAISLEIVKNLQPDYVVVAWDKAGTNIEKRREIYAGYKANRHKAPDDFYAQIPMLLNLIDALGWKLLECDGYEADDIIGTLSKQADEKKDWETIMISSDLDMLQVVDYNTRLYRLKTGFTDIEEIDIAGVEKKYGIEKSQFLDLKAIKGDSSDNIPGVPGVGEVGAVKLLKQYGTLDGIYEHIDEIPGALGKKMREGKESAYMSKKLAEIYLDAPVELDEVPKLKLDKERIVGELRKLEFNSLIRKYDEYFNGGKVAEVKPEEPVKDESSQKLPDGVEVGWDVKGEWHKEELEFDKLPEKVWDLGQGEFLLNPLRKVTEKGDEAREYAEQQEKFEKLPKLRYVAEELDMPLIPILYKMERRGAKLDVGYFAKLAEEFGGRLVKIEQKIYEYVGHPFNLNSPKQLSEVLYGEMGLTSGGKTRVGKVLSTGKKELERLRGEHPVIVEIENYRELAKLQSTYVEALPKLVDGEGRIHTTYTQDVTATGRLSSVNPNLQNIPVRTEEGRRIREGFVASEGKVLVSADYAQFELRLAAAMAGDEALVKDFNDGVDIHTKTASDVFHVPMSEVSGDQRRAAKVINFGVLYGMSAKGLADAAGMSVTAAKEFIDKYFELRAPIRRYLDATLEQAKNQGYVETLYGRRRPTPDVKSPNYVVRAAAERAAMNMPIQGTEADLMKKAMIEVDGVFSGAYDNGHSAASADALLARGMSNTARSATPASLHNTHSRNRSQPQMLLQVHDSLIVECDAGEAEKVGEELRRIMEGVAPELSVRLAVEVSVGENWGEL